MNSLTSAKMFVFMLLLLVIAILMLIRFLDHRGGPIAGDAGEAEVGDLHDFLVFPFQLIGIARLSPPERCAICRRRFRAHHRVTSLPRCRHIFHPRCIRPWLDAAGTSNGNCPLCRRSAAIESDTSTSDTSPDAYPFVDRTAATDGSFSDPDPFISPQLSSGEEEGDSHNHRNLFEIETVPEEEEAAAEHSEVDAVRVGTPKGVVVAERDCFGRCLGFIRAKKLGAEHRRENGSSESHMVGEGPVQPQLGCFRFCRRVFKPRKFGAPGKEGLWRRNRGVL
ncbi:43kDa postsynaptic protein [Parasponia andersonii]|uniref:43kDa postsynaptic protein n=1 Tax=Parasponia andersonii TaxID=3476 RepID=A0A2P5C6X1_PARAD|nr:43kDa postsynaptic protein [Parasponia andersonii]